MRQALDLEHWAAFGNSLRDLEDLLDRISSGRHGEPPGSVVLLSGDVHHAYLARAEFSGGNGARAPVYQAVCSPLRNPLDSHERHGIRAAMSRPAARVGAALARAAGVPEEPVTWTVEEGPWFDNQVATIELDGRQGWMSLDKVVEPAGGTPHLERVMRRRPSLRQKASRLARWPGGRTKRPSPVLPVPRASRSSCAASTSTAPCGLAPSP